MQGSIHKKAINQSRKKTLRGVNSSNKRKLESGKINKKFNKATIARELQLQELRREYLYSCIALLMKFGLMVIFLGSFFRLGIASHQRVMRNLELFSILKTESKKLHDLNDRFDNLFAIGGDDRLIAEQEHLIAPNSVRIIWH